MAGVARESASTDNDDVGSVTGNGLGNGIGKYELGDDHELVGAAGGGKVGCAEGIEIGAVAGGLGRGSIQVSRVGRIAAGMSEEHDEIAALIDVWRVKDEQGSEIVGAVSAAESKGRKGEWTALNQDWQTHIGGEISAHGCHRVDGLGESNLIIRPVDFINGEDGNVGNGVQTESHFGDLSTDRESAKNGGRELHLIGARSTGAAQESIQSIWPGS